MVNPPFDVTKDYFAVLGVHHLACDKTIKQAYRKMARRYHPDVSKIHNATQKFQEISEAFEILTKYKASYWKAYCRANNRPSSTSNAENDQTSAQSGRSEYWQYNQARRPVRGKDKIITYPLTLRYAIRLLKIGYFYIPGLKVRMKFSRLAFQGKTFRIRNKGYPGLFGGEDGDYLVKFKLRMTGLKWALKGSDLYGEIEVPKPLLSSGNQLELESPVGRLILQVPRNYSSKEFIKVENMGLPGDDSHSPGHLYAKLIAA